MSIEKYIVTSPWNVSSFKESFSRGQILVYDTEKEVLDLNGKKFENASREVAAGKKIVSPSTKVAILIPYSDKVAKQILSEVQKVVEKQKVQAPKMVLVNSDDDLIDVINLDIKPAAKETKKELPALNTKLEVVEEGNVVGIVNSLMSEEALQQQVEGLQKPLKMKVINNDAQEGGKPLALNTGIKVTAMSSKKPTITRKAHK